MKQFMKRMPRKLRIGPLDWTVATLTPAEQAGDNRIGVCEPSQQRIRIQENPSSTHSAVDTMLHELGHAIFWTYHVRVNDLAEEPIVCAFGTGLTQIFRDNPDLWAWIAEGIGHA